MIYQLVSEAVEQVSVSSQRLCKVMGLPQRESCPTKSSLTAAEDDHLPGNTSSSAAVTNKKEKEKEKKGKKPDSKKAGSGKDKERVPSRGKSVAARKSKTSVSSKDTDTASEATEQTPSVQPVQQVDPLVERKYRENLYASVYAILVATVEKMVLTLPEQEL
ncbi:hypothetical protein GBAR_LOCUS9427 [Geodia barretti]|uniref:Uncharacterized protein n=1 Tax=Geodia barretti TaxID=519541 RepID=A0AA35RRP9_GEOBA|nr:hypothetical protein GBAR_LOCUS9427 [Geodia barretti]